MLEELKGLKKMTEEVIAIAPAHKANNAKNVFDEICNERIQKASSHFEKAAIKSLKFCQIDKKRSI